MTPAHTAATIASGLLLGWSVAWPPGPINAEMIRRGLTRGFWPAYAVGLGACTGDFLWALAVALGAGALADVPGVRPTLAVVSFALLLFLAWTFLSGAWRSFARRRSGDAPPSAPGRFDGTLGGFVLGLTMALSSPWNIAFWLAVIGQQAQNRMGLGSSLLLAGAVVLAATAWGLVLCSAVRLGARFATRGWEITTQGLTGLLMLYFAFRLAWSMLARFS